MRWFGLLGCVVGMMIAGVVHAADPRPLTPAEAAKKVGERVTVRMTVKAASIQRNVGFLNSETNHRDEHNFVIFLTARVLSQFRDADIPDPAAHFKGKTIEVEGQVELHRGKPEIILERPKYLRVIEERRK